MPVRIVEVPAQSIPVRISEDGIKQPTQVRIVDGTPWWRKPETITSICAGFIALLALFLSLSQARAQKHNVQLQTFESALQRIGEKHVAYKERYEIPLAKATAQIEAPGGLLGTAEFGAMTQKLREEQFLTTFQLLNAVEYMALLINTKRITDRDLRVYFDPAVVNWYDQVLRKNFPDWESDKTMFEQFKRLYRDVKERTTKPS